ncbi:MAG: hypothetical protein FJX72_14630, partial [Armatimonadetes bacterium]|nr:hypothetical protein [Armatimonadota bacterium]
MANPVSKLESIDRIYLYGVLLLIVIVGLLVPIPLPLAVGPQARGFYDAVENADTSKIAIVSTLWSASTQGENRPQTRVILQHLMRKKMRFALIAFGDPQSTTLAQELAEELARENNYVYGKDWINWGFRADIAGTLKGLVRDINETMKRDSIQDRPLASHPVMRGVH